MIEQRLYWDVMKFHLASYSIAARDFLKRVMVSRRSRQSTGRRTCGLAPEGDCFSVSRIEKEMTHGSLTVPCGRSSMDDCRPSYISMEVGGLEVQAGRGIRALGTLRKASFPFP